MSFKVSSLKEKKNLVPLLLVVAGLGLAFHKPISSIISPANLEMEIQHPPIIMPAAYKVYANENALEGKYSLFKMVLTNNSRNSARNVEVTYQIPNYIEWKTAAKFPIILPGQSVVVSISAGSFQSFKIQNGTLWDWGWNGYGQLGIGNTTDKYSPTRVNNSNNWRKVVSGSAQTIALKTDNTLWGWGNWYTTYADQTLPAQIGTGNNWRDIAVGLNHNLALKSDGTLWAWGSNAYGQLGTGNTNFQYDIPIQIGTANDWAFIATGFSNYSLALKTNGTLWAWGDNTYGQLGIGNTTQQNNPVQVGTDNNWQFIEVSYHNALALKTDGTLWTWGDNTYGQLGIGNTVQQNSPVQIGTGNNWVQIKVGRNHSLALKTDGTLWSWGDNMRCQLGIGNSTQQNIPVQVGNDNDWNTLSAGYYHNLAVKNDGTLWAWGDNGYGELGLGNVTANQCTPTQTLPVESVLPILITNFIARNTSGANLLSWTAVNDEEVSNFDIERSLNGIDYFKIGETRTSRDNSSTHNYNFTDNHPNQNVNFYRLKEVFNDRHIKYSNVLVVKSHENFPEIIVFPNPAKNTLQFNFTTTRPGKYKLMILNSVGQICTTLQFDANASTNSTIIDVSRLKKGLYFIFIPGGNRQVSFIKD
jgi:alpha-tubulin suppressor-like RCC1 family protein